MKDLTLITYVSPKGNIKTKEVVTELVDMFSKQLKKNRYKVLSVERL